MIVRRLVALELGLLVRRPATWIILGLLALAMIAGSAVGVQRMHAHAATIERVEAEAARAVETVKAASARYAVSSDITIPVFRDPTDAYSYMYNFMQVYAINPPAPLAAVAAGQSDLQPAFVRISMQSVFPDTAYELRSPRVLALGSFDLGFVLVFLLPLVVIALAGSTLVGEQDSGVLRLIAAQPLPPRTVALAKFGALASMIAPTATIAALTALAVTGGIGAGAGVAGVALLGAAVALYALLWVALCALVASFWRGAVQSLALLVLAWAAMTVVIPAAGALLSAAIWPAPSRIAYIDASRALADEAPASYEWEAGAERWLTARPDLAPFPPAAVRSAEVGRMAHDAFFRDALAEQREGFTAHAWRLVRAGDVLRLLSPAAMLDGGLEALAGTDMAAQLRFTAAADAYGQRLRRHFEPLILANIGRARACQTCPGRLNFSAYDAVPRFAVDRLPAGGHRSIAATAGYLLVVLLLTAGWAARRFRYWPV